MADGWLLWFPRSPNARDLGHPTFVVSRPSTKTCRLTHGQGARRLGISAVPCSLALPCSFDSEGIEVGGFAVVEVMLDEAVDATAARTAAQAGAEFGEVFGRAVGNDFHFAFFRVADPATQVEFAGLAVNEPAEAYALDATLN